MREMRPELAREFQDGDALRTDLVKSPMGRLKWVLLDLQAGHVKIPFAKVLCRLSFATVEAMEGRRDVV